MTIKQELNYGKILGMSNNGYSSEEIARAVNMPTWMVVEVIQIGYGRSLSIRGRA